MNQALTLPCVGDVVDDKFRIERLLGEGGTSTIYRARHVITDKAFVIKWLSPELARHELAVQRFIDEARVCGRFKHPNAVEIYDIGRVDESYYLLMELLEGESLESRLERVGRLSVRTACDILLPCIDALEAAHRVGIVHRDLKPSNIFLCRVEGRADEVPKVLDFGISKLSPNGHPLSPVTATTRNVIGTPLYMAPEQMRGHPAEPRFDVYALGVVLYELVTGQPPFECDTLADLVFKIIEGEPPRVDEVVQVDSGFADIVARAMAREADDRFATMAELAAALSPYGSRVGVSLAARADRESVHELPAEAVQVERPSSAELAHAATLPSGDADIVSAPSRASRTSAAPIVDVDTHATALAAALPAEVTKTGSVAPAATFDDFEPRRPSGKRSAQWVVVAFALGVALVVAWHTSAREPRAALEPPRIAREPAVPRTPVLPSQPSAAERAGARIERASEPVHPIRSGRNPAPESEPAVKRADATGAKGASRIARAHSAESTSSSPPHARVTKRQGPSPRHDRGGSDDDMSLPEAELSHQDF